MKIGFFSLIEKLSYADCAHRLIHVLRYITVAYSSPLTRYQARGHGVAALIAKSVFETLLN